MRDFFKKKDFLYSVLLCIILLLAIIPSYFCYGNFLYDCGREFLVPEMMNDGLIPVKDIFLSYFPFSYQINALLFKIFGSNFDTLRISGCIFSFVATVFMYLCARKFTDERKSFLITLITVFICMFNVSYIFNWIFAYSYAFIYAAALFFVSLYFAICYIKEDKFLYPSFFVLGLCFALKAEFIFLILPYIFLLIYKKTPIKKAACSILLFSFPIILSFLLLFIKGFNFSDLVQYFEFLLKFMNSKILALYNKRVFHATFFDWWGTNLISFLKMMILFVPYVLVLYLPSKFNKKALFWVFSVVLFFSVFIYAIIKKNFSSHDYFSYLGLTTIFIFIYSVLKKNAALAFFALVSICLAARFHFIYLGNYSTYILPSALIINLIFCFEYLKSKNFNRILTVFMLSVSILNVTYFSIANTILTPYRFETEKGVLMRDNSKMQKSIENLISFMKEIPNDKTVLLLPEGPMFNYVAGKKTNPKFYQLLPNHIETLEEENIVFELEKNPPDYVIITNQDYALYGTPYFCRDFGQKICRFVFDNYNYIDTIGRRTEFIADIYKK